MAVTEINVCVPRFLLILVLIVSLVVGALCIRIPDRIPETTRDLPDQQYLKTAVFALGSFWRSEAVFGCLPGVVRTTVGYAGGSKTNPEYRSLGDHAESVQAVLPDICTTIGEPTITEFGLSMPLLYETKSGGPTFAYHLLSVLRNALTLTAVEYDSRMTSFRELLGVFWSSHDPRQVFGQGPDVGGQYSEESRLASASKEKEQTRSRNSIVTTQITQLGKFYPAEADHQKFELKQNPFLLQLIGNLPEEELQRSSLAIKLNGYVAELCPPKIQRQIDAKINDIMKKGWPILREL